MAKQSARIPMQHPTKKDENGRPAIQHLNSLTVRNGKAAKMGYLPVPKAEMPPVFTPSPAKKVTPAPKQTV